MSMAARWASTGVALHRLHGGPPPALRAGRNLIAVKVDNRWDPTLAPRAGEHVFSGGIYRDVWLVARRCAARALGRCGGDDPGLADRQPRSSGRGPRCATPSAALSVTAETELLTDAGRRMARLPATQQRIEPGQIGRLMQRFRGAAPGGALEFPRRPLYRVRTTLKVGGQVRDVVETSFGFRWVQWTADKGFFLNGQHRYFARRQRPGTRPVGVMPSPMPPSTATLRS